MVSNRSRELQSPLACCFDCGIDSFPEIGLIDRAPVPCRVIQRHPDKPVAVQITRTATPSSVPWTNCSAARRIWCGSGRLTLYARFGYKHWPAMLVRQRRWLDRASGLRTRRPGGCDMGSLGPTHLISLLLAVAIIAATCGFIASAVVRRNKRRARGFFLLGFFCGLMAGAILRGRRRGLNALAAVARRADGRPLRAGIRRGTGRFAARALTFAASHVRLGLSPPQWHRQLRM